MCVCKMADSDYCDRLIALSDSWVVRPGHGRWSHRQLTDNQLAATRDVDNPPCSSSRLRPGRRDDRSTSPSVDRSSCPIVIVKDSSSCDETSSDRRSRNRLSLRGVVKFIDRRRSTSSSAVSRKHHHQRRMNGARRLDIGDPVAVRSDALQRKMERLGCVDVHSSDSLLRDQRDASPIGQCVDTVDLVKYFGDMLTVPTGVVDQSLVDQSSGQDGGLFDQILDDILRDIDLLDQTLADGQLTHRHVVMT